MKRGLVITSLILGLALILIIPLISAPSWGGGYYRSPLDYLENEWIMFGLFFVVFFAIIFYTVNRAFKNPAVSGVIALGLSLMISMTMAQRGLLYGYVGEEIGSWLLIVTVLIGVGFLIRFIWESFGKPGTVIALIGLWFLLRAFDPYEFLPYELLTDTFIGIYEFFASFLGLIIIIIGSVVALNVFDSRTIGERLIKQFSRRRPR